jgi:hypothetical protein
MGRALTGEMRNAYYNILVRKYEGKRPLGRIILKYILNKFGVRVWTGFDWLRIGSNSKLL